jgi:PBP1b-binding outer membrane lipoprotein LpoB|tara:strand:+ start:193 stop:480 length:288 start_codon:yes stop_codon:yes gene_type:complete
MAYTKSPRPYKREYQLQKAQIDKEGGTKKSTRHRARMERQRARRKYDKKGISRKGKDIGHRKALAKGGSNKDGTRLESRSKNRSRNGKKRRSAAL